MPDRPKLPHIDHPDLIQFITVNLFDALPLKARLGFEVAADIEIVRSPRLREAHLDRGFGCCLLDDPGNAAICQDLLIAGHRVYFHLYGWVIMPNHLHLLLKPTPDQTLARIIQRLKGVSTMHVNRRLGREGSLWRDNYFDRYIRDEPHFWRAMIYIHENPVKAGLVPEARDWPRSSAGMNWITELS